MPVPLVFAGPEAVLLPDFLCPLSDTLILYRRCLFASVYFRAAGRAFFFDLALDVYDSVPRDYYTHTAQQGVFIYIYFLVDVIVRHNVSILNISVNCMPITLPSPSLEKTKLLSSYHIKHI